MKVSFCSWHVFFVLW